MNKKLINNNRLLMDKNKGQDYVFNGCMEYLMNCLKENDEYDYWFFAGMTGDVYTQVFNDDPSKWCQCLTHACFDISIATKAFDACGYDFQLVDEKEFNQNKQYYIKKIISYIDKGIPIIAKGFGPVRDFSVILGYNNDGKELYYFPEDSIVPTPFSLEGYTQLTLVFIGNKKPAPTMHDNYKKGIESIPNFMTLPTQNGISFGIEAFKSWANSYLDGRYEKYPVEQLDTWKNFGSFLLILACNSMQQDFSNRAKIHCPEFEEGISKAQEYVQKLVEISYKIMGMEGGFDLEPSKLKQTEIMCPICNEILTAADISEKLLNEIQKFLRKA